MAIDAGRVRKLSEQLRSTGMLIIPESPIRQWATLLGCVAFTVLGAGILMIANQSRSPFFYTVTGIVCIGFFGVVGIPGMMRKILRRSRLVVTPEGLRLERRSGQSFIVNESARWTDIAEFFGEEVSGGSTRPQLVVGYTLTPLGQQMRSQDPSNPQLSQQVNEMVDRGTVREGRVYLPGTLEGGKEDLLAVLQQAHQTYGVAGRA